MSANWSWEVTHETWSKRMGKSCSMKGGGDYHREFKSKKDFHLQGVVAADSKLEKQKFEQSRYGLQSWLY